MALTRQVPFSEEVSEALIANALRQLATHGLELPNCDKYAKSLLGHFCSGHTFMDVVNGAATRKPQTYSEVERNAFKLCRCLGIIAPDGYSIPTTGKARLAVLAEVCRRYRERQGLRAQTLTPAG